MNIDLTGKTILVTGAGRGIGLTLATYLAKAGAKLILHANNNLKKAQELVDTFNNGSIALQANLDKSEETIALFQNALDKVEKIDVIVNNAGISITSPIKSTDEEWVEHWDKTMRVNLQATGILCKKAIQHFKQNEEGGIIINISSRAAFRGDTEDYMAYAASKGGMVALTRSIARAFGKENITAFTIAPGFTRTDMAQEFIDIYGEDYAAKDIALDKLTEPEDLAPTIVFLASGLAKHATGSTIDINAGSYVH
ncbi:MAG: SDR family oxidoreductase [Cyclobacteriaceae bacterium]|nr:SDR family oxidoreductase [Cyclobacteriaceae bacterium]